MDKLKMQSENLVDENVEKIAKLFPNCITEGKDENGQVTKLVDFDLLKQELSKVVVDGNDERYTLNWAGKKQAILTANSPINATLRPCREESVDFDNTKNLYIEGDNLDVLKLLRETYLNKIKMIYIDPPYNTGNDFVYNDDFASSSDEYLQNSKSYNEDGNRMVQNLESNGRFHSDWLSMMYSRLKLAKDLLKNNGCIFISIDDNEVDNLKKICDEIFGERNFVCQFVWRKSKGSGNDSKYIMVEHEYIIMYSKNIENLVFNNEKLKISDEKFNLEDEYVSERGRYYLGKLDRGSKGYVKSLDYGIEAPDGTLVFPNGRDKQFDDGWRWMWSQQKVEWGKKNGFIVVKKGTNNKWNVYAKSYAFVDNENKPLIRTKLYKSHIGFDETILNISANAEIKNLFGNTYFSYPKPVALLKKLLLMLDLKDEIILDFFSGSTTTAHAVMQLNAEDGGNRKFIMVQLPEKCDEKSEAYKAGFKNICEIGKERIRRAGMKIISPTGADFLTALHRITGQDKVEITGTEEQIKNSKEYKEYIKNQDIGFRVLKLDSSNMKDVYYSPSDTEQTNLLDLVSNIKEDRSPEDLLFQVMLDMGVMLSSDIKTINIKGKKVFNINDGNLVCCFDENLTDDVVTEIAKLEPLYAVFRDSSMSSDSVAVNFDQIFETYSPSTTRKVL